MKISRFFGAAVILLLTASLLTGCMMMQPVRTITTVTYDNPQWAPPYYPGARYYYLPDMELYYDLSAREFIYLSNGRWVYSPYIPSIYSNYDLNNEFCIVLNRDVYMPWMHHQYYVSHYPRYYYRDYYDHSNFAYVRAYNENLRSAVYWNSNERHRARQWDDSNLRDNRRFQYSKEDSREYKNQEHTRQTTTTFGGKGRVEQQNTNNSTRTTNRTQSTTEPKATTTRTTTRAESTTKPKTETTTTTTTRTPVTSRTTTTTTSTRKATTNQTADPVRNNRTNYYGRTIGTTVKVTKEMKEKPATPTRKVQQTNQSR